MTEWNPMSQSYDRPSLADFLLARIAEDEREACGGWMDEPPYGAIGVVSDCDCGEDHGYSNYLAIRPRRFLAECETRRQIVAVCVGDDPDQGELDPQYADERVPALVLRLLALPYSDHPEYREEWRP